MPRTFGGLRGCTSLCVHDQRAWWCLPQPARPPHWTYNAYLPRERFSQWDSLFVKSLWKCLRTSLCTYVIVILSNTRVQVYIFLFIVSTKLPTYPILHRVKSRRSCEPWNVKSNAVHPNWLNNPYLNSKTPSTPKGRQTDEFTCVLVIHALAIQLAHLRTDPDSKSAYLTANTKSTRLNAVSIILVLHLVVYNWPVMCRRASGGSLGGTRPTQWRGGSTTPV